MNIEQVLEQERLSKMLNNEHLEKKAQDLKNALSESLNNNSVHANTSPQNMRISSNLIDFKHRAEVFRNWDKQKCKEAKKAYKQANNDKQRSELISLIVDYSQKGFPHYDAKFSALN